MTKIQVASPFTSTVSIFMRFYNIKMKDIFPEDDNTEEGINNQIKFLSIITCGNIFVVVPCLAILIGIFWSYVFKDPPSEEIEWVFKNFEPIRVNEAGWF